MSFKVAIIGAGIGGLCLAQSLKSAGIEFQIFERDSSPSARRQGYRLHLDADGIHALKEALPDPLYRLLEATSMTPLPYTTLLDPGFGLRRRFPTDDYSKTQHHVASGIAAHINVNRTTLRQILMTGLEDHMRFGAGFDHYRSDAQGVTLVLSDGEELRFDLLVGADGAGSAVRRQRAPQARMMDSGARSIYGRLSVLRARDVVPAHALADLFTGVTSEDKMILGLGPVLFPMEPSQAAGLLTPGAQLDEQQDYLGCIVAGRHEFFGSDDAMRAMDSDELQAFAATVLLRRWSPLAAQVVEAGASGSFFYIQMESSVPFELDACPNVTLLGDAAHTMTPSLGRGANVALHDAALLGRRLAEVAHGETSLAVALRRYEQIMMAYGFDVVRHSAEMGARLLGQNPLPQD